MPGGYQVSVGARSGQHLGDGVRGRHGGAEPFHLQLVQPPVALHRGKLLVEEALQRRVLLAEGHAEIRGDVGNAGYDLELSRRVVHHHHQGGLRVDHRIDALVEQVLVRLGVVLVLLHFLVAGQALGLHLVLERLDDHRRGAAELHADDLARQVVGGLDDRFVGTQEDDVAGVGVGHGEQHLLRPLLGDRHGGDDAVEFLGVERRDDAVPGGVDKLRLDAELGHHRR